ncbi:hypothetical protein [Streptococcus dysgalactiae]|uniref:hypothetical protein n=1 Tax=Streptococcus dysgalactiae TaxID=1334 RepID=UPI001CF0ED59|nr:hypothetical protein [Streptococcus dysgalactiae]MCB2833753.1 hypothetical protein [Streptococcus dysgalactiae subsp. dysgalactiae]MCB2841512.1 hypothetical protein [Streptococcus dysgalactiae subsp. dysgalactiae]MCB2845281.1 hypothetical protein [Streptococcus dysgalactiae subsp. dysgalactiae]
MLYLKDAEKAYTFQFDSKSELFTEPVIPYSKEFNSEEAIEIDEWFYIKVKNTNMIDPYVKYINNTVATNSVKLEDLKKVNCLFYPLEDNKILFQKITPSKKLINQPILKFADRVKAAELVFIDHGIEIGTQVDAFYDGKDKLYFRDFHKIRILFADIEKFYTVASDEEIESFFESSILVGKNNLECSDRNKKMIAILSSDEIDLEDKEFQKKLLESYSIYPKQKFEVQNGKFIINTGGQLTSFLKLALGRLYTNPLTDHQMEASTAKRLN